MGRIAFVFSGQGDQGPGMGKDLYEKNKAAREIFDICDGIRKGTSLQCFNGTDEELKETVNTQPCLFAMEYAAANLLKSMGVIPEAVAGFSLGEVVAASFAGKFTLEDGFKLVCKRGELMQQAASKHDTAMAAVVKLSPEIVEELCKKFEKVYPVNYNCPGQISVSGLSSEMKDFSAAVKAAGGRSIPLKVKGAFHSPFMEAASMDFKLALEGVESHETNIAIYSNKTAKPYEGDVVDILSKQICSPVKWEETIRNMIAEGFDTFIEIGPGKTLTNMIGKIDSEVKAVTVYEYLQEVEAC